MRVIRDGLGEVRDAAGTVIHSKVRVLENDQRQIAVFAGKTQTPPVAVYNLDDGFTYTRNGGCSTCQGWPARRSMQVVWERHEREQARAV